MLMENTWIHLCWLITLTEFYQEISSKVIIQSSECTQTDLENKIQCFKEIPKDKYEVLVNDTIIMRCIVENQHGRVQWRAQKMTMGFDRAIPAMPRFRITGDASKSEYFLTIYPIQLSDNGDYECQVEPIKHHPLLRRRTRLFVYKRPTTPQIWYQSRDVSYSSIVIDPNQDCIFLKCISYDGVPGPTYLWKVNNKKINSKKCKHINQTKPIQTFDRGFNYIFLHPSELKDKQWVECLISNPALKLDSEKSSLDTKVEIQFQKRPGKPVTATNKILVDEGASVRIKCSVSPPGLPNAQLTWKWSNKLLQKIPTRFHNLQSYSVQTAENNQILNTLNIPLVTKQMHATTLLCESAYFNQSLESSLVLLLVNYLPSKLEIFLANGPLIGSSEQKDFSIYPVKEGEVYVFKCKTSQHYGNYHLSWKFQKNFQQTTIFTNLRVVDEQMNKEKYFYTQISSIEILVNRTMHSSLLVCYIGSKLRISAYIHLEVLYLPKEISISSSYSNQDSYLTEGDIIEVNCTVDNGNPIPHLSMYIDEEVIAKTQFSKLEMSMKIKVERKHDHSKIYCQASNQHFPHVFVQSKSLTLTLALLPRKIFMKFVSPNNGVVESGQRQTLSCTVVGSSPEPSISWRLRLCQTMTRQLTEIKENCQLQDIKTVYSNFSFLNSKESQLTSIMTWQPTWLYHKSTVICKIYNYHFPRKDYHKTLEINVVFKPKIFVFPKDKRIKIVKGQNKTFIIDVAANPRLDHIVCLNCTEPIVFVKKIQPFYTKWSFSIINASIYHHGLYNIFAVNKIGSSNFTFFIDIIVSFKETRIETIKAFLSSSSNTLTYIPPPSIMNGNLTFVWSFQRKNSSHKDTILECNQGLYHMNDTFRYLKLFVKCKGEESTSLVFYYIDRLDNGNYICNVTVDGRVMVTTVFQSVILVKPSIFKHQSVKKCGCDLFNTCLVSCFFTSSGNTNIQWFRMDNESKILNSTDITFTTVNMTETNLEIFNVSHDEFGQYICKISNSAGSDTWSVDVIEPSAPERPVECKMSFVENSFAIISWSPGYNGGREQIFKIQWTTDHNNKVSWNTEFIKPTRQIENLSYLIKDLASNISCFVKISASNIFGESEYCTHHFTTKSLISTSSLPTRSVTDHQYLKVLAYILAICSVTILLIVIIHGLQKVTNILRDRRSFQNKSMNRFTSLNNRLYSSMDDNDKDISMIFTNRVSSTQDQVKINNSVCTSLMNISDPA